MQKILIIEDDRATRKLASQVLRFEGFEVLEAANGRLGVEQAISCVPDLIVCDIMMPELDGFGVLRALRENPLTALTPFIFLTAKSKSEDRRQGMDEGADDFISKPFLYMELAVKALSFVMRGPRDNGEILAPLPSQGRHRQPAETNCQIA